jgi:hypothetical protein
LPALAAILAAALAATDAPPGDGCVALPSAEVGSAWRDLARVAELTGATPVRSRLFERASGDTNAPVLLCPGKAPHWSEVPPPAPPESPTLELLPLSSRTYLNSRYSDDRNDGAVFEGKGVSTTASAGARLRWRFLSAAVEPLVAWQQNRDFVRPTLGLPGYSAYANPFNGGAIDLPLVFGPTAFTTFDPGQSYVRVDAFGAALGFSTENLWWGPGVRNSLLMSNSAPGFPHVFLGTSRPVDIFIGWLEGQLVWGRLRESKWFDSDPTNDRRLFTALNIGFEPSFIPGLFVGAARVYLYVIPPGGLPLRDYIAPLFGPFLKDNLVSASNPTGDSTDNQLFSVFARWVFPEVGLEIYGEWARDDHSFDFQDFVTEPEHSQAFLFGLQKVFRTRGRWLRVSAELTHTLQKPTNNPPRSVPIFYTHGSETQGYTNDGQMLGAGIGPQADSQYLAADLFLQRGGRLGGYLERVLRNDRYFYDVIHVERKEDVEIGGGFRGFHPWRELDLEWSFGLAYRYSMDFGPYVWDWKGLLGLSWTPGRTRAPALPTR